MKWQTLVIGLGAVLLTGCSTLDSVLGMVGLSGAKNQIETLLAAQTAGVYEVKIEKDGNVLLSEKWECTKDATSGKLTGCHKR